MNIRFSPVEQRMLDVLGDGYRHTKQELFQCLDDDLSQERAVRGHICRIRKKLAPAYGVLCEYHNRRYFYRYVRFTIRGE